MYGDIEDLTGNVIMMILYFISQTRKANANQGSFIQMGLYTYPLKLLYGRFHIVPVHFM